MDYFGVFMMGLSIGAFLTLAITFVALVISDEDDAP